MTSKNDSTELAVIERRDETGISVARPEALVITPQYVEQQKQSLALLQQMTKEVLVYGRDYGKVPGIPDFLWDPGASQINGAFNVFPGHRRILSLIDDTDKISVVLEVPLIQRNTGAEVGSGVGASSTQETKHKYRWVPDPDNWGYTEDAIETLKTKVDDYGTTLYRVKNPEHAELLNVVIKQASKRAEVDAVNSLPGVSSALKELFGGKSSGGKSRKTTGSGIPNESPKWTKFWGEVRALDITPEKAHEILGVTKMEQWLSKGNSLDDAIRYISEKLNLSKIEPKKSKTRFNSWDDVVIGDIDDYSKLENVFEELTGKGPEEMYRELGGGSRNDMTVSPVESFYQLKEVYNPNFEDES